MTRFVLHGKYSSFAWGITNPFKMIAVMAKNGLNVDDQNILDWCVDAEIWHAIELVQGSLKGLKGIPKSMPTEFITLHILIEDDAQACVMRMRFPELKFE